MESKGLSPSCRTPEALAKIDGADRGRTLIRGATVVTMDPDFGTLGPGDVLIEGERIAAVGTDLGDAAGLGQAVEVDARGCVVIPGLVDAHRHCWQTQLRRLLPDGEIMDYQDLLHHRLAPVYEPEDMYIGTRLAIMGALDSGVTCALDFSHNMRTFDHGEAVARAWQESGARGIIASCLPLAGTWAGDGWRDVVRLRSEYFPSDDSLVTLRMGFMARVLPDFEGEVCLSPEGIRQARELGIGISVDGTVGPEVAKQIVELGEAGVLGPDITWIHCTDLTDAAWGHLVESEGAVALAVTSDQQLAIWGSIAPIQRALDHNITPGLSVDVECSLTTDMFTQMQVVLNVQRMFAGNRRYHGEVDAPGPIAVRDALEYATVAGAKANGVWDRCGSITPGKDADLVIVDAEAINNLPLNNAVATVVLGTDSRNVDSVFVAGRPLKWAGNLISFDLKGLRKDAIRSRDRVLERCGYALDVAG